MRKLRPESNVLLPARPETLNKIRYGDQKVEFRKTLWDRRNNIERVFMYEAFPTSRIVGYFDVAGVLFGTPETVYNKAGLFTGYTKEAFIEYAGDSKRMYGVLIRAPIFFKRPVYLQEVRLQAPQSFFYLDDDTVHRIMRFSRLPPSEENEITNTDRAVLKHMSFLDESISRQSVHHDLYTIFKENPEHEYLTEDDFKHGRKGTCWFKRIHDSIQRLERIGMISKVSKRRVELTEKGA